MITIKNQQQTDSIDFRRTQKVKRMVRRSRRERIERKGRIYKCIAVIICENITGYDLHFSMFCNRAMGVRPVAALALVVFIALCTGVNAAAATPAVRHEHPGGKGSLGKLSPSGELTSFFDP